MWVQPKSTGPNLISDDATYLQSKPRIVNKYPQLPSPEVKSTILNKLRLAYASEVPFAIRRKYMHANHGCL